MNKEFTVIARLAALMAALAFVGLLAITIVAFATQRQFLRVAPYTEALLEVNAYERSPGILAELFVATLNETRGGLARQLPLPEVSQSDVELFLSILLPRDWLQSQTEVIVRRAIAGLNGEQSTQPAVLSLVDLKEQLNSQVGRQALLAVIDTRPACGATDLSNFTCGFNLAGEISCRPPSLNLELCGTAIDLAVGGMATQIPDQIDLDAVLQLSDPLSAPLREHARRYVAAVSLLARFGWFVALPFLLVATLLAVRSFAGLLRWWGAPLLAVALCLLPVIALTLLWPTWYIWAPLEELALVAPSLAQLLADVAGVLSQGLVLQLVVPMILLGGAGVGMLALSFLAPLAQRWVAQG